ncbi:hypothetical protein B0H14DRAFT_3431735 [Mycena olivaceomarginata]|nr:hypothetical protein B0H14DRAFT_3431735 [Mycena olivaceomarginata]
MLWRRGLELELAVAGPEPVLSVSGHLCIARVGVPKTALVTKMETAQASCQGIAAHNRQKGDGGPGSHKDAESKVMMMI